MNNTIYSDKESFDKTLNNIKQDGFDKLHILADFDNTMTKAFSETGERQPSLVHLLRSVEKQLGEDAAKEDTELFNKYHPIEIDSNIDIEEKKQKMIEWWKASFNLFIKYGLNKNILRSIVKSEKIRIRKGIINFLKILEKNNVPLIIISASGIGRKSISYFLEERGLLTDNIKIISNDFNWDEAGNAISYKQPIIHSFNKGETVLEEFPEIYNKIKTRTNVILLGDSLGDYHMVDGFDYKNLINIGFLNDKEDELIKSYKERYDLILTGDNEAEILNELF